MKPSLLVLALSSSSSSFVAAAAAPWTTALLPMVAVVVDVVDVVDAQSVADAVAVAGDEEEENGDDAPADATATTNAPTTISNEELASFGLTLDQYESVRGSESPNDFGGLPSQGETDGLWADAAVFEYEVAMSQSSDQASAYTGYRPYLVCSTSPGTGNDREQLVRSTFESTPGVSASEFYSDGNLYQNTDAMSCGVLRAYNDTIAEVYAANPDAAGWMRVNPLHPSMKMAAHTVETMESWFNEEAVSGDVVSISGSSNGDGTMQVKVLGLHMMLCPGVQEFDGEDVPDEKIKEDVRGFLTENGGKTVEELSFYHHRVSGMDGNRTVHTFRMEQWSAAVSTVRNWTDEETGFNACLETVIEENMDFAVLNKNLEVSAKMSFWEGDQFMMSNALWAEEHIDICIWYMAYGLALNPMVCSLEPKTKLRTLCKDGSSDLTKCTGGGDAESIGGSNGDSGDNGGGTSSSSVLSLTVMLRLTLLFWWLVVATIL